MLGDNHVGFIDFGGSFFDHAANCLQQKLLYNSLYFNYLWFLYLENILYDLLILWTTSLRIPFTIIHETLHRLFQLPLPETIATVTYHHSVAMILSQFIYLIHIFQLCPQSSLWWLSIVIWRIELYILTL